MVVLKNVKSIHWRLVVVPVTPNQIRAQTQKGSVEPKEIVFLLKVRETKKKVQRLMGTHRCSVVIDAWVVVLLLGGSLTIIEVGIFHMMVIEIFFLRSTTSGDLR